MRRLRSLLLPALLLPGAACDRGEPGRLEVPEASPAVVVSPAVGAAGTYQVPARVVAVERAELATRTSGSVRRVSVDVGSRVRRGEILVRLDDAGVESAVAAAQAQETVARRYLERIRSLHSDGAAAEQELDQAQAGLEVAQAALAEALAAREYVALRAPFAGTVTARMIDPGDLAVPGQPVLVVEGDARVKIEADLPASLAGSVAPGDGAVVVRPETGERWTAEVTRVVPVIERSSQRFRVEASFLGSERRQAPLPGSFVRLDVGTSGPQDLWVPADAVLQRGQLTGVYVLSDGRLRLRWLRTGQRRGAAVEVLAGLAAGELVARSPDARLTDGLAVDDVQRAEWTVPGGIQR